MKTIAELKAGILQSVSETDDQALLSEIQAFINNLLSRQKKIVAYDSLGNPLTIEDYQSLIEEAQAEYRAGRVISQEDLEREL